MNKKLIIALMVVLVAGAAYYMYKKGEKTAPKSGDGSSDITILTGQWAANTDSDWMAVKRV